MLLIILILLLLFALLLIICGVVAIADDCLPVGVISIIVGTFIAAMVTVRLVRGPEKDESIPDIELIQEAKQEIAFEDSVYQYMLYLNIKHPEVVLKQARIESGNFKSQVFLKNNNMFGMRVPKKRANLSNGENLGYAVYNTWQESVIDYALYQSYSTKGMTKEEYIKFLSNNYAEDPSYDRKLK